MTSLDIIFDIDGTLANAEHRLHFIKDPDKAKDWENFLSDEQVANDTPIPQTWSVLEQMLRSHHRVIFITGRPNAQRETTINWLMNKDCLTRVGCWAHWHINHQQPKIFMRSDGDRRPSSVVKRELLDIARYEGYDPKLVFEDRMDDTAMWREAGLLCCQVAEGNY